MQTEKRTARRARARQNGEQPKLLPRAIDGHEEQPEPRYIALAADGLLAGLTREQVMGALIDRIERDAHYLAYRKACRRHTRYDEQVTADLRAIALAICWLSEPAHGHVV